MAETRSSITPRAREPLRSRAARRVSKLPGGIREARKRRREPPRIRRNLNISPFSVENKRPPSKHPFSSSYTEAGMILSSIPPPPRYGVENQKIPNEAIFPPNLNQTQPLVPSTNEAACAFPPLAAVVREDTPCPQPGRRTLLRNSRISGVVWWKYCDRPGLSTLPNLRNAVTVPCFVHPAKLEARYGYQQRLA